MTEFDPTQKYARYGHIDQDRFCDAVVARATQVVAGDGVLPPRWRYKSQDNFVQQYGHLGKVLWAKTASYHLLVINGEIVLRIWTDSPKSVIVDLHNMLASFVKQEVIDCPASVAKKTRPLTKRVIVTKLSELDELLDLVQFIWLFTL